MRNLLYILLCLLLTLPGIFARAQIASSEYPQNKWLILTEEQFQQGHYQLAIQSAGKYLELHHDDTHVIQNTDLDKAKYYRTVSYLKLNINGSVDSAINMIANTSDPVYKQRTAYALAHYYFQHDQLASAIPYYELAGIANLSNREIVDEKFELAYCYFNNRQFDKAEPLFASIKELQQGRYFSAGNYYYGLLAYNENNYKDALQSFDRIKEEPQYHNIVPYYIAEIYYFMGNRKKALEEAERLISRPEKLYYDNELHLLAAQCLFEEQRYGDALPYFESYYDHTDKIRKEELYEMAYCYYRVNEWQNAIDKFKPLSNTRDSLGQTAMYLLGDCYLKAGDKKSGRNAFGICADMPFNHGQQEAAMMLYAKLSSEMGYNDDAVQELKNLLAGFSNSHYKDEAKTMLSDLLIKTNNYEEAYNDLQDVNNKDESYWRVYQKVTFGYAMQQLQTNNIEAADKFLSMSLTHPVDENYRAVALFWKGELAYRMHNYQQVLTYSQDFVNIKDNQNAIQRISPAATAQHAHMNMGYAAMEMNDFKAAQGYFDNAQRAQSEDSIAGLSAALNEADAVFMQKDYTHASALYDKVIAANGSDADYARYQKSILLGLQGKKNEKIALLQTIINEKPASKYAGNAYYEQALTYIEANKYQQAIAALQPLTEDIGFRNMAPKAWMKTGFAYQQLGNNDKAIESYKHVVVEYPAADERASALDALKSLYIQNNKPAAYTQLLKDNNIQSADSNSVDSTYYSAAEAQFASGNWDKARQAMGQYLQQYPNGLFIVKAHYYRAESNYQLKNFRDALADYDAVLNTQWNEFSENSAKKAASIAYQNKDYDAAAKYYKQLRGAAMGEETLQQAYVGLIKSNFNLGKFDLATAYADTLLSLPHVSEAMSSEAMLYKAKSLQTLNKNDSALNIYSQLDSAKDGPIAAESRYHAAEILLQQNKLKDSETAANNTIKKSSGYDYWIVKSYILLSDVLVKEKDYFNAKATLQSVVHNTKISELKQIAVKKLEEVRKIEKQQSKLSE
ncbi:MAG TPA: tetratricopeptide repeat protein [Flavipsychrobacter sp.]|nr:tetratricopeptide repeat protein [Flavipsychrobacter sp.]